MPKNDRHHYVPKFYLSQWAGADGKLCEYSRPHKQVRAYRRYPAETSFERGLNTLASLPDELEDIIERRLFCITDDLATRALRLLLDNQIPDPDHELRLGWARFIISLTKRNPEALKRLAANLRLRLQEAESSAPLPQGLTESERQHRRQVILEQNLALLLETLLNSELVGTRLITMRWAVVTFAGLAHPLLTSDRPIVMTKGLGHNHSHIAIPISPTKCFVAAASIEEENRLKSIDGAYWAFQNNDRMARQARKFVYGVDDVQLRFVTNRFGSKEAAFPGDC